MDNISSNQAGSSSPDGAIHLDDLRKAEYTRSSACSNTKNSEVTQGLLLPCITYGKAQFELQQAKQGRTGDLDPAEFNPCNSACVGYGFMSLVIPWFGGGVLAHRQAKEITRFYDLQPHREKSLNVFAHNATTIRNLAEIRHHENIPPVELQPHPQEEMLMVHVPPEPLPSPQFSPRIQKVIADVKEIKKPKAMSVTEKIKQKRKGKAAESEDGTQHPGMPARLSPFTGFMAEDPDLTMLGPPAPPVPTPVGQKQTVDEGAGPSTATQAPKQPAKESSSPARGATPPAGQTGATEDKDTTEAKAPDTIAEGAAIGRDTAIKPIIELAPADRPVIERVPGKWEPSTRLDADEQGAGDPSQIDTLLVVDAPKTAPDTTETTPAGAGKSKSKFKSMFRKTPKTKENEQSQGAKSVAENLHQIEWTIPRISIGEGPMTEQAKENAIKRYQTMVQTGEADPVTLLDAAAAIGAFDALKELPPARTHSLSEDTVLISRNQPQGPHRISADAFVYSGRAAPSHLLAQDRVINAVPTGQGAHRLSADTMLPVRTIAPSHYLDADPVVSGPQQLFPHELLDDMLVQEQNRNAHAHGLELDKTLVLLQKQPQAHDIHQDGAVPAQPKSTGHDIHRDIILPAPRARSAHELGSDKVIDQGSSAHEGHNIHHDVRILSPSGAVRDPHSVDDDEVFKESAVFRKSPHPEAMMPGNWAPSSSSQSPDLNHQIASLNASLQSAGHTLDGLNRAMDSSGAGKENTADSRTANDGGSLPQPSTGRGMWGRVFGRRGGSEKANA